MLDPVNIWQFLVPRLFVYKAGTCNARNTHGMKSRPVNLYLVLIVLGRLATAIVAIAVGGVFPEFFTQWQFLGTSIFYLLLYLRVAWDWRTLHFLVFRWLLPLSYGLDVLANLAIVAIVLGGNERVVNPSLTEARGFSVNIVFAVGVYWLHVLPMANSVATAFLFGQFSHPVRRPGLLYWSWYLFGPALSMAVYALFVDVDKVYGVSLAGTNLAKVGFAMAAANAAAAGTLYTITGTVQKHVQRRRR